MIARMNKLIDIGIGVTLVGIGALINYKLSSINNKDIYNNCFLVDRLIDSNCNGSTLHIGISGKVNPNNIFSHQGIRLGQNGKIRKLISCVKVNNGVILEFEDNIKLIIVKNDKKEIIYTLSKPEVQVTKEISQQILSIYKPIGMSSTELDSIADIIKDKELQ